MHKSGWMALTLGALMMAGVALAHEEGRGGSMDGCADMMSGGGMMGGGMMGGSRPNERWSSPLPR